MEHILNPSLMSIGLSLSPPLLPLTLGCSKYPFLHIITGSMPQSSLLHKSFERAIFSLHLEDKSISLGCLNLYWIKQAPFISILTSITMIFSCSVTFMIFVISNTCWQCVVVRSYYEIDRKFYKASLNTIFIFIGTSVDYGCYRLTGFN